MTENSNDNNESNDNLECLICFEKVKENIVNHYFTQVCECKYHVHDKCLVKWLKTNNKCIICRKPIYVYEYTNHYRNSYYKNTSDIRTLSRVNTCNIL